MSSCGRGQGGDPVAAAGVHDGQELGSQIVVKIGCNALALAGGHLLDPRFGQLREIRLDLAARQLDLVLQRALCTLELVHLPTEMRELQPPHQHQTQRNTPLQRRQVLAEHPPQVGGQLQTHDGQAQGQGGTHGLHGPPPRGIGSPHEHQRGHGHQQGSRHGAD